VKSLTILVPTFQEASNILGCCDQIDVLSDRIKSELGLEVNVLFIDNHSSDSTFELISDVIKRKQKWSTVQLDRNYGVQASLLRGMSLCTTDSLLVFQSDLQDPIEVAFQLVQAWSNGKGSVIAGITLNRAENFIDRLSRKIFYSVLSKSSDYGLQPWFHDFYVLDKRVYSRLYRQGFQHEFIRGRISEEYGVDYVIPYSREPRLRGKSSFNFARKYAMALDGILRYGSKISRYISVGSLAIVLLNSVLVLTLITSWIMGYRSSVQGWMSLVCINLLILSGLGVLIAMVYEFLFRILRLTDLKDVPVIQRTS
jgi:dolichol-phosphate mannosyltransferase